MQCYHLPPGGIVDQSVLQQRAEHEEHAGTRPDVHRLAVRRIRWLHVAVIRIFIFIFHYECFSWSLGRLNKMFSVDNSQQADVTFHAERTRA